MLGRLTVTHGTQRCCCGSLNGTARGMGTARCSEGLPGSAMFVICIAHCVQMCGFRFEALVR